MIGSQQAPRRWSRCSGWDRTCRITRTSKAWKARPCRAGKPKPYGSTAGVFLDRSKLRYPSDVTDEEWAFIEPLIPQAKRGGNKRTVNVREVVNGLMYILGTGC